MSWPKSSSRVAAEQDFAQFRASGTICRGWVKVKNGDVAEGIPLLRSGLAAYRATGAVIWLPQNASLLARAYEIAGQIEEAVAQLDEALEIIEGQGSAGLRQSSIGTKASCCSGKGIPRQRSDCIAKP